MVKFISYDGSYPNLCSGTLVLEIDGKEITFPKYCMHSGGSTWFSNDYADEHVESGRWSVDVPDEYNHIKDEIEDCVNESVGWGCCGGCL